VIDDEKDTAEFATVTLNQYFDLGHIHSTMIEEDMIEESDDDDNEGNETSDVEVLSQKLSQLSTKPDDDDDLMEIVDTNNKRKLDTYSSDESGMSKKIKSGSTDVANTQEVVEDKIPTYLEEKHKLFDNMIRKVINTASSLEIDDLRRMAHLIHNIAAMNIKKEMSLLYLKCGTGTLQDRGLSLANIDWRVWPKQVLAELATKRQQMVNDMNKKLNDDQQMCEQLVYEHIEEYDNKIQQYQKELNDFRKYSMGLTSEIEETIECFVQQYGIEPLRIKSDLKKNLLEYDYAEEIIQRQFFYEQPNEYQVS